MRPKFVLCLIIVVSLVLAAVFYHHQNSTQRQPPAVVTAADVPPAGNAAAHSNLAAGSKSTDGFVPAPVAIITPAPAHRSMTPEEKQEYIEAEISRLQEWSTQNDPASLSGILNSLTNSEKAVRLAAIEAAKQFGSRDAIPVLQADVADAADTEEKIALLQAADFLTLPTIAEVNDQTPKTPEQLQAMQQARQRAADRKNYLMQKHAQNANALPPPAQGTPPPQ